MVALKNRNDEWIYIRLAKNKDILKRKVKIEEFYRKKYEGRKRIANNCKKLYNAARDDVNITLECIEKLQEIINKIEGNLPES